jgi:hypothetical protein
MMYKVLAMMLRTTKTLQGTLILTPSSLTRIAADQTRP